jgi:hypothetical protein
MENPLILRVQHKYGGISTIQCTDQEHFDKLLIRFKKKGYKQIPYVEQPKVESLPF